MTIGDLEPGGVVAWNHPVPCAGPGVYIISLDREPTTLAGIIEAAPISPQAVDDLLSRRPELTLDGKRAVPEELTERLTRFWLPDEVVLYIGLTASSLAVRVNAYYRTPLGARSPHAGGWFLKTLHANPPRWVHWAQASDPGAAEDAMLRLFCANVTEATRQRLFDALRPFPFANLEWPRGVRKRHGIRGAKRPRGTTTSIASIAEPQVAPAERDLREVAQCGRSSSSGLTSPLRSQQVTAADRDSGQIRIPAASKRIFPKEAGVVSVFLRGREVAGRWNPRIGSDRERSGTLRVGRQDLAALVPVGTILVISPATEGRLELT